ncbi:kinase-like domain-containing protein [Rhypophila decipiens]|uniref:Kinase-like domain-containing protein n=1 Tax=Rhypophila decipiens TaxID=261697 RepID=A0AAN6XTK0_9PEZI|nr:kinase-like domain-containing protein [Rhypophila decipiens]
MVMTSDSSPLPPPGRPSRYGLEGAIVEIVKDRGEQHFRIDIGTRAGSQADHAPESETLSLGELTDQLILARKTSVYHKRAFIPRQKFYKLMSLPQVRRIINELGCFEDAEESAHRICFGRQHDPPCLKLLASLVGIKSQRLIKCAMDDKMGDDCLPLESAPGDLPDRITCQVKGHDHSRFDKQLDLTDRGALITYTYHLTAVYLKQLPDRHFHYVLDSADHLPMQTLGHVLENLQTNEVVVSEEAPTDTGQYQTLGGFGQVFKVEIDPCHFNFISNSPRRCFALKKLNDTRSSVFEEELKSLLYCLHHKFVDENLLDEGQKHMAHVRASFEIRNKTNRTTNYYFIFDWQEGNLSQFWTKENHLRDDEDYPKCMAEQIFGLAAALQLVHNDRRTPQRITPPSQPPRQTLYGRHGDLSPSNILYSKKDGKVSLKLADFGLAQLHSRDSRTFGNSKKPGRTETYKGPEFEIKNGEISRATDMFSFGCVLLEYITWYLLGPGAVTKFSDARLEPEVHRGQTFKTDVYWILPSTTSQIDEVKLKPQVYKHIEKLKADRRCSWFLCQTLDLIVDRMINPNPSKRIPSWQLTKELDNFRKSCHVDRDYYAKCWRSIPQKSTWKRDHGDL